MITTKKPKTTEEKIDLILKYTRAARRWAVLRGVISFIFLFVFIILPLIGGFYLFRYFKTNVDLENVSNQYYEFQDTLKELKDKSSDLDEIFEKLPQ